MNEKTDVLSQVDQCLGQSGHIVRAQWTDQADWLDRVLQVCSRKK